MVRDALSLDLRYYSAEDPGLIDEFRHRLRVAAKQILLRPGLLLDAIRKADLKALLLPDEKRILIDQRVPTLKQRWVEAHEIGHSIIPWHAPYMFGDNDETLDPTCRAYVEAEANYAGARLLFLNGAFGREARDSEMTFANIRALAKRYGNTITSSLWRVVQDRFPEQPVFGMIGAHPYHPDLGSNGEDCRYFIRSAGFKEQFPSVSPEDAYAVVRQHASRRKTGPVMDATHVFADANGQRHEFRVESFSNGHNLLTYGAHQRACATKVSLAI